MVTQSLCWCMWISLVVAVGGSSLIGVCGLLTAVAFLVAELGLQGAWAPWLQSRALEHRLNSCGAQA